MHKSGKTSLFQAFCGGIWSRFYIKLIILCAVASLMEGRPRTLNKCGRRGTSKKRIVGGTSTEAGEHPWMVSLHFKYGYIYEHSCAGTILNEYYILTAAHCIHYPKNPWKYRIYAGVYQLSKKYNKPAKMYKVKRFIIHENYTDEPNINDIALIRTKQPIQIEGTSGYVNGICLPYTNKDPSGWAVVVGWGSPKEGVLEIQDSLQVVKIPLLSRKLCRKAYEDRIEELGENYTIIDSHICASLYKRDSCQADSGGPLLQRNEKGIYTQIGIVSFGEGCARQQFPGVYTKVASYMNWMEENMKEEQELH